MEKPLTVGSLFAGIGGFDLGFQRAGYEIKFQVEIEPFCQKVLTKHFPNAQRFDDVRTVGKHNLPYVDVICGGFPCQDISVAGKGVGITGTRSGLWTEMHRIIGELRPKYVVVENVRALLGRGMGKVLGALSEIGYDAEWQVIPASAVGAPHKRERIWIVAYPSEVLSNAGSNQQRWRSEEISELRDGNSTSLVANSNKDSSTRTGGVTQFQRDVLQKTRRSETSNGPDPLPKRELTPDSGQERVQRVFTESVPWFSEFSWCKDVRRVEDLRGRTDIPEPLFRGSRDGIPDWVDRIGALGNAVVPQIPEFIANQILKYERSLSS